MNPDVLPDLVQGLGWTLVHFLWQGAAIAALFAVVSRGLRNHPPNHRYLAGCAALLLLAIAPVITFYYVAPQARPTPILTPESVSPDTTEPIVAAGARQTKSVEKAVAAHKLALSQRLELFLPWMVVGWGVGVAALTFRLAAGWWQINRLKRFAAFALDGAPLAQLLALKRRLGISRPVCLLQSTLVEVPAVIGWLRPVILLPASCVAGLSPAQFESILAHELAHIRRHDYLVNLLQSVLETLLFYHPAVWWISRLVREERELCCDDLAVETCGDRLTYARALTTLEELRAPANLALAANGPDLLPRIQRLAGKTNRAANRSVWPMAVVIVLLVLTGLGLEARQYDKKHKPSTAPDFLNSIKISTLKFDNVPLREALAQLSSVIQARDPEHKGLNILVESCATSPATNADGSLYEIDASQKDYTDATVNISHPLHGLRLCEALDAITKCASRPIRYSVLDHAIVFSGESTKAHAGTRTFRELVTDENLGTPKHANDLKQGDENVLAGENKLRTRVFHVDSEAFMTGVSGGRLSPEQRNEINLKKLILKFFSTYGVDLDTNHLENLGKAFVFNDRKGILLVHTYHSELDAIEHTIMILNLASSKKTATQANPNDNPALETRTFHMPKNWWEDLTGRSLALDPDPSLRLRKYFSSIGLDVDTNNVANIGKMFTYNASKNILIVRARPEELDLLENAANKLNQASAGLKTSDFHMVGRSFVVKLNNYYGQPLGNDIGSAALDADKLNALWEKFFTDLGIDSNTNHPAQFGKQFAYVDQENRPRVTASPEEMNIIENALKNMLGESSSKVLVPTSAQETRNTSRVRQTLLGKLNSIKIATLSYDNKPLPEVLNQLSATVQASDPESKGLKILMKFPLQPLAANSHGSLGQFDLASKNLATTTVNITHPLHDIRLADALDVITKCASRPIQYSILNDAIVFVEPDQSAPPLETRVFHFDPEAFLARIGAGTLPTGQRKDKNLQKLILNFFSSCDVDLHANYYANSGKAFVFQDRKGILLVHASAEELDRIDAAIKKLVPATKTNDETTTNDDPALETRTFQVKARWFETLPDQHIDGDTNSNLQMRWVHLFVAPTGVDSSAMITYNDRAETLTVRALPAELDALSQRVKSLALLDQLYQPIVNTNLAWVAPNSADKTVAIVRATLITTNTPVPPLPELNIKVKFIEIDEAKSRLTGFDTIWKGRLHEFENHALSDKPQKIVSRSHIDLDLSELNPLVTNSISLQGSGTLSASDFKAIINELEQRDGVDELSAPEVTTLSKRQAQIQAGETQTYVTGIESTRTAAGKATNIYHTREIPVGVIVDIVPEIQENTNDVRLTLRASQTEFLGYDDPNAPPISPEAKRVAANGAVLPLPHFRLRQLTADRVVEDGGTIVMTGLECERATVMKDQVPVLGSIPLIGRAFRSTTTSKTRKNLLVFVTATLINADGTRFHPDKP